MKIVFVGGGTGGHFYPLIAVAEEMDTYVQENKLMEPKKYYFGPNKYDEKALFSTGMDYVYCPAGKIRRTRDATSRIKNFCSYFPIIIGAIKAMINLLVIFPDVVFSKGGYASFPVLFAARMLRIPVVIHESDTVFGRVTKWSVSFAKYIAISYPESEEHLTESQKKKAALVGIPMRRELLYNPIGEEAYTLLRLERDVPVVAVLGGSSGARYINDNIVDALPVLLKKYQVVHQTGERNIGFVKHETKSYLKSFEGLHTYQPIGYLNSYYMRVLYSVADIIVTRAGSGTLYEIAEWGLPSIVIPIREEVSHDQRKNAYAYARATGNIVIEEQNLNPHLLTANITQILNNKVRLDEVAERTKEFATPEASKKIAHILVSILRSHEK